MDGGLNSILVEYLDSMRTIGFKCLCPSNLFVDKEILYKKVFKAPEPERPQHDHVITFKVFELIGSEQKSRLFRINKLFDLAVHVYIGILFLSHSYNVFDGVATQSRCTQKFLFELEWWDLLDVLFVQRTIVVVHVLEDVD